MTVERRGVIHSHSDAERADHVRALFEQMPAVLAGNAIGIVLMVLAFWPIAPLARIGEIGRAHV